MPMINLPAGNIHYREAGTGEPLLLLSANPGDSRDFAAVMPELATRYRVIAPDWPGYGRSTAAVSADRMGTGYFAEVLKQFVTALDLPPLRIIGNSVGGNAAVRLAAENPDRVLALVLVAPGGFTAHNLFTRTFCRWQGSRMALPPRVFAGLYLRRRTPVVREMLARAATEQASPAALAVNRAVWRSFGGSGNDVRGVADQITAPVMLVFGRYDPVISPWTDGRSARRCLPTAEWRVLPCGHAAFAEMPEAFLTLATGFLLNPARRDRAGG
ncbi:MAG TPA: alpha/beta hydrolase [Fluviicoccus sp.]|nr:alpha/beta hydrolase [Fluviicoccus sp.]